MENTNEKVVKKNIYIMKHKNIDVLEFEYDGKVIKYKVLNKDHLPLLLKNDLSENNISHWINKRLIPVEREGYSDLIEKINAEESEDKRRIVLENKALSLSDCYWITDNINEKWEEVNYFRNVFDDEMADIFLESARTIKNKLKLTHTPTLMLDGQLPKAWVISEKGERILLKRNTKTKKNVVNEIVVSLLLDCLDIEHIKYYYVVYKEKLCSACKCMCSENVEMITAEDFTLEDDSNGDIKSALDFYIKKCENASIIKNVRERINEMLTIDYLTGNYDRHWKNFSVLRDANTLDIIDLAPIYDNDRAFSYSSDSNYMVGGMTVDKLVNVIEDNKITKLSVEEFEKKISLLNSVDTRDTYDIREKYSEIIRRFKILKEKLIKAGD